MRKVRDEINEREARFLELAEKSSTCRIAADDLEEEIRACKQGKKEEATVRHSPMDAASARLWSSFSFTLGAAHARKQIQALQEEFIRRFEVPATPLHMAGREERGGEWEEEHAQRAASRQMGPQAPGGRNEGAQAGSAFDPARHKDANGEGGGGGDFNTPGNGPYTREGSRTPRRQQQQMQRG